MATKGTDQFPLGILIAGQRASRFCEYLSTSGAFPGRDIPLAVSHFAQGTIHKGTKGNYHKYTLNEGRQWGENAGRNRKYSISRGASLGRKNASARDGGAFFFTLRVRCAREAAVAGAPLKLSAVWEQ